MQSKRTNDIQSKPRAFNWLKENPEKSILFLEVVNRLNIAYMGSNNGYVDFEPPQYRYNDKKAGEYAIITAKGDGIVKVELMLSDGKWSEPEIFIRSSFDIPKLIEHMESLKYASFTFSQQARDEQFKEQVKKSIEEGSTKRKKRLAKSSKIPRKYYATVALFERNPDVVAEALERAGDICELCGETAPFKRKSDGSPYLEVHHKIFLSNGGEDSVENAIALCPNCHREQHFG
jgi:5-methylcytosine-specific restriction protein A